MTQFDFSHLYKTETADVLSPEGVVLFSAVIKEITHGDKTNAQMKVMEGISLPTSKSKAARRQAMNEKMNESMTSQNVAKVSLYEELAAIQSWTLTDAMGNAVPVCIEAWQALPKILANQLEEVIERLNKDLDAEFPSESDSEGTE